MIKYIIFDLAEVLLTGIKETGLALSEKYGLDIKEKTSPLIIPIVGEFFHGNLSEDGYLSEVLKIYPQLGDKEELKQHIRENFIEVEGTRDIILRLKHLGYTLALLSVHGKEWIDYCDKKFDFHKLFNVVTYSYNDKVSKPNKKSFQLVINRLGAQPGECLFIDDSEINIQVARELGMNALQFFTALKLNEVLRDILPGYR